MSAYEASPVNRRFRRTNAQLAQLDDAIIAAVREDSPVTVRGVYYRCVSAGVIPKTENAYQAISRQLVKLRRNGTVPYSAITDGSRLSMKPQSWTSVDEMLADATASYRRALWQDSNNRVIVLSEKDAISGVIHPITEYYQVELAVTRGYSSVGFSHSIAETIANNSRHGKRTFLYQLGDHDPSGLDAWRDFREKVGEFAPGADVVCERLAVTPGQIDAYHLPTRPTKQSDTRAAKFTGGSVEVDAIPAETLRQIVAEAIEQHVDRWLFETNQWVEHEERKMLAFFAGIARGDGDE